MTKEWVVQAELNGRFGVVRRSDANGTRRTFDTREAYLEGLKKALAAIGGDDE